MRPTVEFSGLTFRVQLAPPKCAGTWCATAKDLMPQGRTPRNEKSAKTPRTYARIRVERKPMASTAPSYLPKTIRSPTRNGLSAISMIAPNRVLSVSWAPTASAMRPIRGMLEPRLNHSDAAAPSGSSSLTSSHCLVWPSAK